MVKVTSEPEEPVAKPVKKTSEFPVGPVVGVVIVVAIYFGSMFAGGLLLNIFPAFLGWSADRINDWLLHSPYAQFMYVVAVEAITLGLLILFMRSRKIAFKSIGLLKPRLRDFGATLLAYPPYFVINAAAALAAAGVFHLNTSQKQQTGFEGVSSTPQLIVTFISLVLLPPIVEEIVMRGFLFTSLKQGTTVVKAALLTSVIFAIAHLQIGSGAPLLWLAAIDTFILSLVLCYLRQRTGSLWAGIGLHMLKNGIAFAVLFIFPSSNFGL
jgi:membrane protease YdiL (CAAX protease family)